MNKRNENHLFLSVLAFVIACNKFSYSCPNNLSVNERNMADTPKPHCIANLREFTLKTYSEYGVPRYIDMLEFPELEMEDEVTIFLPSAMAFRQAVPMDIADPFYTEKSLREKALKNVIIKGRHEIKPGQSYEAINGHKLTLKADGKTFTCDVEIAEKNPSGYNSEKGDLYIVNHLVGVTGDDVHKAISNHPQSNPFQRGPH